MKQKKMPVSTKLVVFGRSLVDSAYQLLLAQHIPVMFNRRVRVLGEKLHELLSRDVLPIVVETVADDDKMPLLFRCPHRCSGSPFDLVSVETPANGTASRSESSCDGTLTLAAVPVPADDLGVSDRIVCHSVASISSSNHPKSSGVSRSNLTSNISRM